MIFTGIPVAELGRVLTSGVDHDGNSIEPFVDPDGGWPLRCCLADSRVGDRLAIIAWSHADVRGPYRETGPIVVHADGCAGAPSLSTLPDQLDGRLMFLRPYDRDHRIVYDSVTLVDPDDSNSAAAARLLARPEIEFIHGRNYRGGCYAFTARRTDG